jgi:hypothetical protein
MSDAAEILYAILREIRAQGVAQGIGTGIPHGESGGINRGGFSQAGKLDPTDPNSHFGFACQFKTAQVSTVQFSILEPPIPPNATATVKFRVRGNTITRVISVSDGVQISGVADAIDVDVVDETAVVYGGSLPINIMPYSIFVAAAPGTRPFNSAPPSLREFPSPLTIVSGATVAVPVPSGKGISSALIQWTTVSVIPNASCLVAMFAAATGIGFYRPSQVDPSYQPLVPGTDVLRITNDDPANTMFVSVVWGIDG